VGAALIFQGPRRGGAAVVREIVDAYRRASPVPPFNRIPVLFRTGLPEWREVDSLDMNWHVQHLALPAPGSDAQLHELVADLHAPMLERNRPGWKVYVIEGLERNRFAIFIKVHHALVDGESGIALVHRSLSRSPRDRRIRSRRDQPACAGHGRTERAAAASRARGGKRSASSAFGRMGIEAPGRGNPGGAPRLLEQRSPAIHRANDADERADSQRARHCAHDSAVGGDEGRRAPGVDANDVGLCVLDAAMNHYLRSIGRPPERPLVAICPVSLQDRDVKQASTQVSIFWTPLGAPKASVVRRIRQVMANTRVAKERMRTLPKDVAYAYAVLTFAMGETLALVPRGSADFFLPSNVLISNVRGPTEPLYLNGARLGRSARCPP
jgi:WS/DGAT/MGAT family acyltransferase